MEQTDTPEIDIPEARKHPTHKWVTLGVLVILGALGAVCLARYFSAERAEDKGSAMRAVVVLAGLAAGWTIFRILLLRCTGCDRWVRGRGRRFHCAACAVEWRG